ncbi:MAG: MarC family protein [Lentisphaerae bacterium]|nr:MarC family protein [Lentisphaerota bacterium]
MEIFLSDAFKIAVLLNPFAVLSTFLALAGKQSVAEKKSILIRTCIAALVAGIVVLFSGKMLFSLLDINLDLFKVGGGSVLLVCSISLVWGKEKRVRSQDTALDPSISVVPLAIPMAVGPGTAAGLIIIGSEGALTWARGGINVLALLCGIAVLGGVMSLGVWGDRFLTRSAISIITRLTGLFLSAIAAKMILEGVRNFFMG